MASSQDSGDTHHHDEDGSGARELAFSLLCGACLLAGFLLEQFSPAPDWVSRTLFQGAYIFGGFFAVREVAEKLPSGKFEIDFLMIVAAAGAAILGEWAEGALLLFLFSIGHALENYAMNRARKAITSLADLAPETALVRRSGVQAELKVADLRPGDEVIIRSNERIAADGFVIKGESSVNQAPITGESAPADKSAVPEIEAAFASPDALPARHRVFAGTINGAGSLEIRVTRAAGETALAKVISMVSAAETRQSPTQSFTKKFEKIFVPAVILLAVLVALSGPVLGEAFRESFYRAMAVLVAASPCALAIATPSAVLSGIARAARGGVLIKGGAPLEALGTLDAIAFDKTGTLTEGMPRIVEVKALAGTDEIDLLRVASAVEALSDHPLAKAVVRDAAARIGDTALVATGFESLTGRGVSAIVEGETVLIGKPAFFNGTDAKALAVDLTAITSDMFSRGQTLMVVSKGDQFLGVIGLMDTPKPQAKAVIEQLRALGLRRMMMISGDNQSVADAVAREVGLDTAFGDLMPEDKVRKIAELSEGKGVAMVGDGVNDAPAMANATVGIAMGAAGSDVALETADIALMGDDLRTLPFAVGLSRRARSVIQQNLWLSLGIVALLIPATLLGLGIGPAVIIHEGSTLLVVANALRLLTYRA
ncbi:MAG TPA: heavy metal translocating P-type ATPase [Alphaproteobacteria bacterium]|nr:heavy metal translocating P-type ATPase [Alphaproteobacteria bacterium]